MDAAGFDATPLPLVSMRDGPVRVAIKRLALWRYQTDLWFTRRLNALRGQDPPYTLEGHCTGCGACCETPSIRLPAVLFFLKSVRWCVKAWHWHVNGFEYIGMDRRNRVLIFSCSHFDRDTKQCDSYHSRPGMCRDYPTNLLDDIRPTFPPACSYYALHREADDIRAELDASDIPAERREYVDRVFYCWEPPPGQDAWHPELPDLPADADPTAALAAALKVDSPPPKPTDEAMTDSSVA